MYTQRYIITTIIWKYFVDTQFWYSFFSKTQVSASPFSLHTFWLKIFNSIQKKINNYLFQLSHVYKINNLLQFNSNSVSICQLKMIKPIKLQNIWLTEVHQNLLFLIELFYKFGFSQFQFPLPFCSLYLCKMTIYFSVQKGTLWEWKGQENGPAGLYRPFW